MRLQHLSTISFCGLTASVAGLLVFSARFFPSSRFRIAIAGVLAIAFIVAIVLLLWRREPEPEESRMDWQTTQQVVRKPVVRYYLSEHQRISILFAIGAAVLAIIGALT